MSADFSTRLFAAIDDVASPAMVGLDPRVDHLPEPFLSRAQAGPSAACQALREYHRELLDVVQGKVAIVKPQAAFFECLGTDGFAALADCVEAARERGLLVLMDAKRGDIGSTSTAYAQAFLSDQVFPASDALTINPYLGEDACQPFIEAAEEHRAGLFVLVKTSNPGAGLFQDHGQPPLADRVAEAVRGWGESMTHDKWSPLGAVVGATRPSELAHFRKLMPKTPLLLPGFGFQGGSAEGLAAAFDEYGHGAVVNSSRGVLWAHERDEYRSLPTWQDSVAAALDQMITDLRPIQFGGTTEAQGSPS